MDEPVSETENGIEHQSEGTDTSDESEEEVSGAQAAPTPCEMCKSLSDNVS